MKSISVQPTIWQRSATALIVVVMSTIGMTGFASADSISTTGARSNNVDANTSSENCHVTNTNNLNVRNNNNQQATTGNVVSNGNTVAGDAASGTASNNNNISANIDVDNSAATCGCQQPNQLERSGNGSISDTGSQSNNTISDTTNIATVVINDNNVTAITSNNQMANSGSVTSVGDTSAGSASSGKATNNNAAAFLLRLSNSGPQSAFSSGGHERIPCETATTPAVGLGGGVSVATASVPFNGSSYTAMPRQHIGFGNGSVGRGLFNNRSFSANNAADSGSPTHFVSAPQATAVAADSVPTASVSRVSEVTPAVMPVATASTPMASISNTGFNSNNTISTSSAAYADITNTNTITTANSNNQNAYSGAVTSSDNSAASNAGSGAASNGSDMTTAATTN